MSTQLNSTQPLPSHTHLKLEIWETWCLAIICIGQIFQCWEKNTLHKQPKGEKI